MDFQIEVNNELIDVREGDSLLEALRNHGVKIPTLCHMNRFSPAGTCRLCVVEVEGKKELVTSCSCPVEPGMKVRTNSPRVIRARKSLVELLLSNHPDDCLYCLRNGHCELQQLAEEMNIKERRYYGQKNTHYPDYSDTSVGRDPAKCVLCARCVRICEEVQLVTAIDFISRGNQTMVNSAFHKGLNVSSCIHCGQCIQVCPTAALIDNSHIEKITAALANKTKEVFFYISPSVAVSLAAMIKVKSRKTMMGRINAALKRCGASRVFSLGVANDINIREEALLLLDRLKNDEAMPLISSCCPSWVSYVEDVRPELLPCLAAVKSPQQILGSLGKTSIAAAVGLPQDKIFGVAVMPCVAKKFEASREENTHHAVSEIDAVLTVRELVQLFLGFGLDLSQIEGEQLDEPFDNISASGWKLGYSGGKAEAVAREVFSILGHPKKDRFIFNPPKNMVGRRETKVSIGGKEFGFAWVSSISEAEQFFRLLEEEGRTDIHYVEVMACLDGCVGGGGQPISRGFEMTKTRRRVCIELEKASELKGPMDNLYIQPMFKSGRFDPQNQMASEWLKISYLNSKKQR